MTAPDAGAVPYSENRVGKPAPGSAAAVAAGCTCPVLANAHGEGFSVTYDSDDSETSRAYYVRRFCPVHDPRPDPLDNPTMRPRPAAETGGRDVD